MEFKGPALTVDAIIAWEDGRIVLIRRGNEPFKGAWALPGGFVDMGETIEEAIIREVKEECGIDIELVGIHGVYSAPGRDPRGHTVSVVYTAFYRGGELAGGDDAAQAKLFEREELPEMDFAFDHKEILAHGGWI
ncbi:MAG TPA: NUDIX hydrolase [bacterium]|jgi:8-oxo-dGTP diphosphatase